MFLLVLDDIWNEDPIRFDTLKKPLLAGAHGSRVIITTRNNNVASVMGPKLALHLNGLRIGDSWALFCHFAFKGKSVQDAPSSLVTIGKNIVEKSNGVPLVIRLLGSVLSVETREESWADVLENDLWELDEDKKFIFPILKISYQCLPSPIKPCFAYCASFPKGYEFDKDNLVRIWDALGFILSDQKKDPIVIGISFVDDLISRSFFQIKSNTDSNEILTMHDLIHDLASLIAGNECLPLKKYDSANTIFHRHLRHLYLRHLSIHSGWVPINGNFALRSFHFTWGDLTSFIESKSLQYLKVLEISFYGAKHFCESISHFKHLRYVSFFNPEILEYVCQLYNLQTLKYHGSEMQLRMDLGQLINLKHLILPVRSIQSMPVGISRLRNLQTLRVFAVSHDKHGASLAELKELNNLKELHITQLHHLTCHRTTEAEEACLSKKEKLTSLTLEWEHRPVSVPVPHEEQVLSYLRPHICIQTIEIYGYMGRKFPEWLGERKFSRISKVILFHCDFCEKLPALGELPCLKHLEIMRMIMLKHIGSEFYGSSNISFSSLETLSFFCMDDWEEWWTGEGNANLFPCLVKLNLVLCPMLKSFSVVNMPSLKTVSVMSCDELTIEGLENRPDLHVTVENHV